MNPERTIKWTDSRLDDRFETLTSEVRSLRDIPKAVVELTVKLDQLRTDLGHCFDAIREVRQEVHDAETKREEREEERMREDLRRDEARRQERKSDRHWMVGSAMSAAGLVIAALALLADKL